MKTPPQVPIGPSSLLGWLGALAGIVTTAVLSLTEHAALLSGPGKWSAILGTVALVGTGFGRQFQAAHLTKAATVAGDIAELPTALQALAAEAQKNVALKNPDGVDGPQVPFSGAPAPTPVGTAQG